MSKIDVISSYQLSDWPDGQLVDQYHDAFDTKLYCQMKYGKRSATHQFARTLAQDLTENAPHLVEDETPPEFVVPYKAVPPACFYVSQFCLRHINGLRNEIGHEPGQILKLHKDSVTTIDYASATHQERAEELDAIEFSLRGQSVKNASLVVLDDVRITGATERRVMQPLSEQNPRHIVLGYIASLDQELAQSRPSIEAELNGQDSVSLIDILEYISNDDFDLNIRTLKFILSHHPEAELSTFNQEVHDDMFQDEHQTFFAELPTKVLEEIYHGAIDTGVDFTEKYKDGFIALVNELERRNK